MPDPKLQKAMEEIHAVLAKYDVAGVVQIQSETHGEFMYELSPSWSCASLTPEGKLRIKAAAKTGPEIEKERLRLTVGMISSFHDASNKAADNMLMVMKLVGKHVKFTSRTTFE